MRKNAFGLIIAAFCGIFGATFVSAQTDIKTIDFKNFTYEPFCAGEEKTKITVKDGEFSMETKISEEYTERSSFGVRDAAYGDLTGDGKDEAIILSNCNTGGTGQFSEGFIFSLKNGKPVLLARIAGGDRAMGGLREARVENGLLVVESNEGTASCCAEFVVTDKYRLTDAKLTATGKSTRRELYPAARVAFDKGASSGKVSAVIPAYEMKRFVIGAKAGQTLTLTTTAKNVSFRIFEGDAEESELPNGMRAKLLKNGNYIFEIANNGEEELTVSATVEIK